jgi:hypothetical protein
MFARNSEDAPALIGLRQKQRIAEQLFPVVRMAVPTGTLASGAAPTVCGATTVRIQVFAYRGQPLLDGLCDWTVRHEGRHRAGLIQ